MSAIAPRLCQYITWIFADDPNAPGKKTKHPADHRSGSSPVSAQDPAIWTDYETAKRRAFELGNAYGVGFAITDADQYAFIDIDHCAVLNEKGEWLRWSDFALEIHALFPGAYVEISPSGQGLHIIFSYRGAAPPHGKKLPGGLEFYTGKRFATMTGNGATGDAATDHTAAMLAFISKYATPSITAETIDELTDAPRAEWSGPTDDGALLAKMLNDRRPRALFGAKVKFQELWERNVAKLSAAWPSDQPLKDFDYSSADQSLCNLLAFWTGCHGTRMAALWRASGLMREKLDREDYVAGTIAKACAGCTKVYSDKVEKGSVKLQGEAASADAQAPWYTAKLFLAAQFTPGELPELRCWNGDFYHYQNGIYVPISRDNLRARIYPYLEGSGENPKPEGVSSVVDALASGVYLYEKTKVPSLISDPARDMSAVVVCHNGAWDLDTNERIPLSPNLFALNILPFDYDPNAPDPAEFLKFLSTQWADDPQSIDALQEIGGLLLTPYTHFQKLFFLIGPTRSGKGTILKVWALMLGGPDNVVGPTLASLTKDFGLQPLIGKLAAFIGDVRLSARVDQSVLVERLLSLTGEDALSVPRKNAKNWDGGLFARIVAASNDIPHFSDESGAAAGRVLMLVMKESFLGREDAGLFERLKAELPHILAWHARGRRRLFERGHFIQPESAREKIKQLEDMGQPVRVFIRETCTVGGRVSTIELFRAWQTWCASQGEPPGTNANFGKSLHAIIPALRVTQPRGPDGKQFYAYEGIALTNAPTTIAPSIKVGIDPATVGFGKGPKPPGLVAVLARK